jgi:hypothetical protein
MTDKCQRTKFVGADPCRHDAVRYADALVLINCLLNKPTATLRMPSVSRQRCTNGIFPYLVVGECARDARAALDGEG